MVMSKDIDQISHTAGWMEGGAGADPDTQNRNDRIDFTIDH